MNEFNGTDMSRAFNAGVDAVALECNKRIQNYDSTQFKDDYRQGYEDALRELLEWVEYDMEKKDDKK